MLKTLKHEQKLNVSVILKNLSSFDNLCFLVLHICSTLLSKIKKKFCYSVHYKETTNKIPNYYDGYQIFAIVLLR